MSSIYDQADIYDLVETRAYAEGYKRHWEALLRGKEIRTLLDVSIGTGSVTLPLCELGVQVFGSDLNGDMLEKCRSKAEKAGYEVELRRSDFRELSCWHGKAFDCVASTGNSLPHVQNADVLIALEQMDSLLKQGGYLYLDTRNWDKILRDRNRFYLYNPFFVNEDRVNLVQVWDYNPDATMTFNLLYTFEKENRIYRKERFAETYFPISKEAILEKLKSLGYWDIAIRCFPADLPMPEFDQLEWYCVMAKKSAL